MEKYLDDNVVIPDEIKNMTKEERTKEIARLEAEAKKEKARLMSK